MLLLAHWVIYFYFMQMNASTKWPAAAQLDLAHQLTAAQIPSDSICCQKKMQSSAY